MLARVHVHRETGIKKRWGQAPTLQLLRFYYHISAKSRFCASNRPTPMPCEACMNFAHTGGTPPEGGGRGNPPPQNITRGGKMKSPPLRDTTRVGKTHKIKALIPIQADPHAQNQSYQRQVFCEGVWGTTLFSKRVSPSGSARAEPSKPAPAAAGRPRSVGHLAAVVSE